MTSNFLSAAFRPFFLCAAWLAVIWMGLWVGFLLTGTSVSETIEPILWHGHEMFFGFAMAVIAGFVLTAMQNWTGLKLVTPAQLGLLTVLWLAGRLAFAFSGAIPLWLLSILDLSFLPLLWLIVARTLIKAENKRNYAFIALLLIFWILNILMHLEFHGYLSGIGYTMLDLTVLLITILLVFMGGRVIPFFTANRLPTALPRQWPWLNWASTLITLALIPVYLVVGRSPALGALLLPAAALIAARLFAWKPWHTVSEPMLWILYLGYAWIPAGMILLAAHLLGAGFPWSAGSHALTAGAMSTLILGMMARVALGHSGRTITASKPMIVGFAIITLAGLFRVAATLFVLPVGFLTAAGVLWSLAFLIYAVIYTPIMLRA